MKRPVQKREPFDDSAIIIESAIIIPMAVFGVAANVCTILVIHQASTLRNKFNFYIMSLCLSDLISAALSPFGLYQRTWGFTSFNLPSTICKIIWGGDQVTSIATSQHIVAFTGMRFISIAKPHVFRRITFRHTKISIYAIWTISVCIGFVPYAIFMGVTDIDRTVAAPNRTWPSCAMLLSWVPYFRRYNVIGNPIFFYVPLFIVFSLSIAITVILCTRRSQRVQTRRNGSQQLNEAELTRQAKENHAILQLSLIVGSFAMGYIPITIFLTMAPFLPMDTYPARYRSWWFANASYIVLRCSECLNPIFYNLASSKLRSETRQFLKKACGCRFTKVMNNSTSRPEERSRANSRSSRNNDTKV